METLDSAWMMRIGRVVLLAAAAAMARPLPASAQISGDVAGGYLNVSGTMHGGFGQVTFDLGPRWSVFGQVDGSRGHDVGDDTTTFRDVGVIGGARRRWQPSPRVSPFWQVGVGALHSEGITDTVDIRGRPVHDTFTVNYLVLQSGGGVTVMMTPRVGMRAQLDLQFGIPDQSQFEGVSAFVRPSIGVVMRFGSRP